MAMRYGYARVSSNTQDYAAQVDRSMTPGMLTSCAIGKPGVASFAPDARDGLARDRAFVTDCMLSNAREDPAQFVGTRQQLHIREQRSYGRQAGVLADDDAIRSAEQQRVERLVGALVLQQSIDMDARFVGEDMLTNDGLVERDAARS